MNNYKTTSVRLIILVIGVFVVLFASYGFKIFAQTTPTGTTLSIMAPGVPYHGPFQISIVFGEAVSGFEESDVNITANGNIETGSWTSLSGGSVYQLRIIPDNNIADENVTIEINQDAATLVSDPSVGVPNANYSTDIAIDTDIDIGAIRGIGSITYEAGVDIELPLRWTTEDDIFSQPGGAGTPSLIALDYAVFYDRNELNYAIAADTTTVPPITEVLKDIEYKKPGSTTTETIADVNYSAEKSLDLGSGDFIVDEPRAVAIESANDIYVGSRSEGICLELASDSSISIDEKYDSCFAVRVLRTPSPLSTDPQLILPGSLDGDNDNEKGDFGTLLLTPASGVSGTLTVIPVIRVRNGEAGQNGNGFNKSISSTFEIASVARPDAPTGITTSDNPGTVFLGVSWIAPASNGPTVGYEIQYCEIDTKDNTAQTSTCDSSGWLPGTPISTDMDTTNTTITITSPGDYKVRVRSTNESGNNNKSSDWVESAYDGTAIIPLDFDEEVMVDGDGNRTREVHNRKDLFFLYIHRASRGRLDEEDLIELTGIASGNITTAKNNVNAFVADTTIYPNGNQIADFDEEEIEDENGDMVREVHNRKDLFFLYIHRASRGRLDEEDLIELTGIASGNITTAKNNIDNLLRR